MTIITKPAIKTCARFDRECAAKLIVDGIEWTSDMPGNSGGAVSINNQMDKIVAILKHHDENLRLRPS